MKDRQATSGTLTASPPSKPVELTPIRSIGVGSQAVTLVSISLTSLFQAADNLGIREDHESRSPFPVESNSDYNDAVNTKPPRIDGGLNAWLVVLGTWCASFCSYGWINSKYRTSRYIPAQNWVAVSDNHARCWYFLRVLRCRPPERVLQQPDCLDPGVPNLLHVDSWSRSWFVVRSIRPPMAASRWLHRPRLWPDDGLHLHDLLSADAIPGDLQCYWRCRCLHGIDCLCEWLV